MTKSSFRAAVAASLLGTGGLVVGCARHLEILSRTEVRGSVNASAVQVRVVSTIAVDRGGHSSCEYLRLPTGFNPGTLGTMA